MLHVKVSSRGSGKSLDLSQFLSNEQNEWRGCIFHVNEPVTAADAWLVLEDLDDDESPCLVDPRAVAFLSSETSWEPGHYYETPGAREFLNQFNRILTCHDIYGSNVEAAAPYLPWMINANHGPSITARHQRDYNFFLNLQSIEKTRDLSVFCSTQQRTASHRMRLRFVEELKRILGSRLDWFGNGVQSLPEKWDGLAPYRYTIVLENHAAHNVVTEKIADAYLGLSYPIYWGAPNIREIYPEAALTQINIADLAGTVAVIEDLLDSDTAERELRGILKGKEIALDAMHLYTRLANVARDLNGNTEQAELVQLRSLKAFEPRARTGRGLLWWRR